MTTATDIINKAAIILQDVSNIRWPRTELLAWVSDGQRTIATLAPEAYTSTETVAPVEGTKQTLPTNGTRLISVVRNVTSDSKGSSRAVRLVDRAVLDAQYPDWHVAPKTTPEYTQNYVFDPRNPKVYYIYPPHSGSASQKLEIIYAKMPLAITAETVTTGSSTVSTTLVIDEQYHDAIVDYVLYRAYLKDAEYTQNAERAQLHYQAFAAVVSGKPAIDATVEPTPSGSTRPSIGAPN